MDGGGQGGMPGHGLLPEPTLVRPIVPTADQQLTEAMAGGADSQHWFTFGLEAEASSSADATEKRPWALVVEGDVHCHGNRVAVSRGGVLSYQLTFDENVLTAVWCRFPDLAPHPALCVVMRRSMYVHCASGARHEVPLPINVQRVWSLGSALLLAREITEAELQSKLTDALAMPTLFSLHNPLEQLRPVVIAPESSDATPSVLNVMQTVVGVLADPSLLVLQDIATGHHSVWEWTAASTVSSDTTEPSPAVAAAASGRPAPAAPGTPFTPVPVRTAEAAVSSDSRRSNMLASSLATMPFPTTPQVRPQVSLPSSAQYSSPMRAVPQPPATPLPTLAIDSLTPLAAAYASDAHTRTRPTTPRTASRPTTPRSASRPGTPSSANRLPRKARTRRVIEQQLQAVVYLRLIAQLTDVKGSMDAGTGRFLPASRVFAAHALNGEPMVFLHFDALRQLVCVPLQAHDAPAILLPEPSLYGSLLFRWAARTSYAMEDVTDAAPVICTRSWTRSPHYPDLYDLLIVRPGGHLEVLMGCHGTPMRVGVRESGLHGEHADPRWTPLKRSRSHQVTPQAMQMEEEEEDDDDGVAEMDMSLDDNESMLISPLAAAKVTAAVARAAAGATPTTTSRAPGKIYATVKQLLFPVGPNVTLVTVERGFVRFNFNFAPRTVIVRHCMDALRFVLPPDAWRALLCDFSSISSSDRAADEWLAFVTALTSFFAVSHSGGAAEPTTPARPTLATTRHAWLSMMAGARRMYPGDALFGLVEKLVNDRRLSSPGKTSREADTAAQAYMPHLPPRGAPIELLPAVLLALHLAYEDAKLDVHLEAACTAMCRTVLIPIARKLYWSAWNEAYVREAPPSDASTHDGMVDIFRLHAVDTSGWPQVPHAAVAAAPDPQRLCIQATLLALIERGQRGAAAPPPPPFPSLAQLAAILPDECMSWRPNEELLGLFDPVCARSQTMLAVAKAIGEERHLDAVERLEADRWSQHDIAALPLGLSMHVLQCLHRGRAAPRAHWAPSTLVMVGRDDLEWQTKQPSTSTAWMRSLGDPTQVPRELMGTEVDCINLIKLKFPNDMRFMEVQRLLSSARAPRLKPEGDINEHAVLQVLKQELALRLLRTQAMGVGRGALVLESLSPSLQRSFEFPEIAKVGITPANATVQPLTQTTARWAEFHNGVAAALRVPRKHPIVDRTWILYNKAGQNTTDGGFFLGLGLTGHLASLDWVVVRKTFRTADTFLIVGVILGLCVTHVGTMHSNTSHMLYTHIPALLPSYADELSTPPLIRTAALMGLGLVYLGQDQRQLSAVLVGEIAAASGLVATMQSLALNDSPDSHGWSNLSECYAFTAGAALGLINLAAGRRGVVTELNLAHTLGQIVRGRSVQNSRGEPQTVLPMISRMGAMTALGLIFMRTSDPYALEMLPDYSVSRSAMDTLSPDQMAVCVICRALISWDNIRPDSDWVLAQVPEWMHGELPSSVVWGRPNLPAQPASPTNDSPQRWYHAVLAGAVHALGLRYAGTANEAAHATARSLLAFGVKLFTASTTMSDDRGGRIAAVRMLVTSSALAIGMIMSGTGDLQALRQLRALHNIVRPYTPYGFHMATHMAIGFLFLGATRFSFGTTPRDTAMLFISTFPVFPMMPDDDRYHMQAYRHFYHMAAHSRSLITWDVEAMELCAVPVTISMRDGSVLESRTPCLLPELSSVERVMLGGERYWARTLETKDPAHLELLGGSQVIYVRRRAGFTDWSSSPTGVLPLLARVSLPSLPDAPLPIPTTATLTGVSDADIVRQATKDPLVEGFARHVLTEGEDVGDAGGAVTASFDRFARLATLACVGGDRIAAIAPLLALFRLTQDATPAAAAAMQFARALLVVNGGDDAVALFPASLVRALLDAFGRRIDAVIAEHSVALRSHLTLPASPAGELPARVAAVLTHKRVPLVDVLRRVLAEGDAASGPAAQVNAAGAREAMLLAGLHAAGVLSMPSVSQLRWLLSWMAAPPATA